MNSVGREGGFKNKNESELTSVWALSQNGQQIHLASELLQCHHEKKTVRTMKAAHELNAPPTVIHKNKLPLKSQTNLTVNLRTSWFPNAV